jgi:hypothetical protein
MLLFKNETLPFALALGQMDAIHVETGWAAIKVWQDQDAV